MEGFGLPGLEAMAHGCPLISSDASCLPEVYGDAPSYFDPNRVDELVTAIRGVLTDSAKRERMRERGLARASQFSWRRMACETWALYMSLLERSKPS